MSELISKQEAIDYFVTNVGFHDEDGYPIEDECELRKIWTDIIEGIPPAPGVISRQEMIEKILGQPPEPHYPSWYAEQIKELPPVTPKQPELSEEDRRLLKKLRSFHNGSYAKVIDRLMSAQPEQRTGKWIKPTFIQNRAFNIVHCSECGGVPCGVDENTHYCPNCGAKMEGDAE